jgi:hypothetical protein
MTALRLRREMGESSRGMGAPCMCRANPAKARLSGRTARRGDPPGRVEPPRAAGPLPGHEPEHAILVRDLFCDELPECKRHVWEAFWQSAGDPELDTAWGQCEDS